MAEEFRIFYSWQSDLPNSKTRGFIQDCINRAVSALRSTALVIPDRDTRGKTGSPDIVHTIFEKIEDSDLFIADITFINGFAEADEHDMPTGRIKQTPNPNVLIELGYAARVLGWDRIICLFSRDYGNEDDLPFDLGHRRVTGYSLQNEDRTSVRKEIISIITGTVAELVAQGSRPRAGRALHLIGSYNFETKCVEKRMQPYDVSRNIVFRRKVDQLKKECTETIRDILEIRLSQCDPEQCDKLDGTELEEAEVNEKSKKIATQPPIGLKKLLEPHPIEIKQEDKASFISNAKEYLDICITDELFNVGQLQITNPIFGSGPSLVGTDGEKKKYELYQEASYTLTRLQLYSKYLNTFSDVCFIPLAITNISDVADRNMMITIEVDIERSEIVTPDKSFIVDELRSSEGTTGCEGFVYDEGLIEALMKMPEDANIQYSPSTFCEPITVPNLQIPIPDGYGNYVYQGATEVDYENELERYIAEPLEGVATYIYNIDCLRAKETSWIGRAIVLRPKGNAIKLRYAIKSDNTTGSQTGELVYNLSR